MTEQVLVEFVADTSQLTPSVDKLEQMGTVDAASAVIFKKTNEQLKTRNMLIEAGLADSQSLTVSVNQQQAIYNKLVSSVKNLSGASKDAVQSLLKLSAGDVAKGFQQAAVNVDDYITALEGANAEQKNASVSTATLRTQVFQLTNQLAELTAAGQTNSAQFNEIAQRVGVLKNALKDAQQTVSNLGSDVPVLKVFAAAASGITGAFTAATGAAALFGDKNQDLQEVLVKVNAVMAINQGLSQALNVVRDEAAIATARVLIQEKVLNAQIAIENGLQSESAITRAAATVAQYGLNLAMSLSPVGVITTLIAGLIVGIVAYANSAREAKQAQDDFNQALEGTKLLLDENIKSIQRTGDEQIAALDDLGARQSAKQRAQANILVQIAKEQQQRIDEINALIFANENSRDEKIIELVKNAAKEKEKVEADLADTRSKLFAKNLEGQKQVSIEELEDIKNTADAKLNLQVKNSQAFFAAERVLANAEAALELKQAGQDEEKKFQIRSALQRRFQDIQIAENAEAARRISAADNTNLINAQNASRAINDRISKDEVDAQNKKIRDDADAAIKQEQLAANSANVIKDINAKANQQILENNRKFRQQDVIEALQDQQSKDAVILSDVQASQKDQLSARIDSIFAAAAIEIEQNRGKSDKIKEIEAKRDRDVKNARLASINEELQQEITIRNATNGPTDRNLNLQLEQQQKLRQAENAQERKRIEERLGIQQQSLQEQFAIIDQLTQHQLQSDLLKENSIEDQLSKGLISQKDFEVQYAQLKDDESKIVEDAEKKKQQIIEESIAKQKAQQQALIQTIFDFAQQGVNILSQVFQNQTDTENQDLDRRRKAIQDLSDQGEISAKEASDRNKQLDREQAQLQRKQAQREKDIAVFNAFIAGTEAIIKAYTAGPFAGPVLAAITAAFVFAQIAAIASKPLPQFKHGKKNSYEGLGIWGEAGGEIMEKNGKQIYSDKPTISWIGRGDKIYNPGETSRMIAQRVPWVKTPEFYKPNASNYPTHFDYELMGKSVGKNIPEYGMSIDKNGFQEYMRTENSFTKYLDNRRSWKKRV